MKEGSYMKKNDRPIFENKSLVIWKMAIASALSWEMAKITGSYHPYLAPLTVILCLKPLLDQTVFFAFYRFIGTVFGIVLVILVASTIPINGFTLGILILSGGFIAKWFKLDMAAIEQVALTILLVFVFEQKSQHYALDRIKDMLIGAVIAIIVNVYIFPSIFVKRATSAFNEYSIQLSSVYSELSLWILGGCDPVKGNEYEKQLKKSLQEIQQMKKDLKKTSNTFGYFPFCVKKKTNLKEIYQKTKQISKCYIYLLEVAETFKDWGSSGTMKENDKVMWSDQMKRFSKKVGDLEKRHSFSKDPLLRISLSTEQQLHRYHVTLFQLTEQFIHKSNSNPEKTYQIL